MNAYCTPESSPVSDHGIEMTRPMDCRRTPTPAVLDLCIRRTPPKSSPIRESIPINYVSPIYSKPYFNPCLSPSNYLLQTPAQIRNERKKSPHPSPVQSLPQIPQNHPDSSVDTKQIITATSSVPDTTIPYHPATLMTSLNNGGPIKCTRPFKAYPKDPIVLSTGGRTHSEALLNQESRESYTEFRRRMLSQVNNNNTISALSRLNGNPKMRRHSRANSSDSSSNVDNNNTEKDAAYWERRRKNNEAAKRSRDARRAKEDEIAIRAAFLEHENMRLKIECAALREEITELRAMIV